MAGNSNSGRKPLAAELHLINGNPSKKSNSELASTSKLPAVVRAAPDCPTFLTEPAKEEWSRIVGDLQLMGVVARIDRAELAVYCQAWADWRFAREKIAQLGEDGYTDTTPNGYKQMSNWLLIATRAEERMRQAGSAFGLNPSARVRLNVNPPQGELFPNEQKEAAGRSAGRFFKD